MNGDESLPLAGIACVLVLAATHVVAGKLRFLDRMPRSRWLSIAGGTSVAYVFLHLLPELASRQRDLDPTGAHDARLAWLVALAGLVAFYGLERVALRHRDHDDSQPVDVFWLHIGSFAGYNAIVGYLSLHQEQDTASLIAYAVAMSLHFIVNDFGLREHHEERYEHVGRWLLAGGTLAGGAVGLAIDIPHEVLTLLFAFLAGAVVLNVMKEELPTERDSRFWAFSLGALLYAAILVYAG